MGKEDPVKHRERDKRYRATERGKEVGRRKSARYRATEHGRRKTKEYAEKNRDKTKARGLAWYKANPERARQTARKNHLLRNYGLTLEQYDQMRADVDYRCPICHTQESDLNPQFGLVVDHCHETEEVRGLICHSCNVGLARFRDDPSILQRAIEYLQKPRHSFPSPTGSETSPSIFSSSSCSSGRMNGAS